MVRSGRTAHDDKRGPDYESAVLSLEVTTYAGEPDDPECAFDRVRSQRGDENRHDRRDVLQTGSNHFFMAGTQVPKVEFDGFNGDEVTRVTDLLHDVNGDAFVGSGTQVAMPHPGLNEGGDDRTRGGSNHDSIHAAFGDDLANGDSGGDWVFGDDGADVLWGGKGGTSAASITGSSGSDVLDWRPRGLYAPGVGCTTATWPVDLNSADKKAPPTTVDPCSWFEMTDLADAVDTNNQHHQGVDWQYGGWDRDILQGDQADNGPNEGDRLLDWNGSYNLYTHFNSANGGYNDLRQHSPASAYPSTPGHFDNPNACAP